MKYRTRGGSMPDNKPNVYFSAHPEDFNIYFDVLSEEILKHSNCAIWYGDSDRVLDDEHLFEFGQMQLFVFPVTARFLTQESVTRQEFRHAASRHIPILPIVVERGVEKQFSEICGDIQFVDRTNTDITVSSYDEKLAKFLSAVLLSEDMTQKIREAFDAYIFLSYRKKDRQYAQKLMRLIHLNEKCRDIAIWYDEFLVPGENFKEAIAEAMRSCKAFALTVTPHLLEAGNYVQQIEYPYAQALGKMVLPFEMIKTNQKKLHEWYDGLSECVEADEASVPSYMSDVYQTLAIQPKEKDAVHNFFIGLAYLKGVDVEKDYEKAAQLISGAAEDGLPEAMEKLVSMYREADGVDRDYDEAGRWQVRYVDRVRGMYLDDPSAANKRRLFGAISELISMRMEQGRYEEAKASCAELAEMGRKDYQEAGEAEILLYSLYMRPKIEQGLEDQGKEAEDVRALYLQSCEFSKETYRDSRSELALQILVQSYLELGRMEYSARQWTVAREFFERCVGYCRQLTDDFSDRRYRELLSEALSEHANVECRLNQLGRAREELEEAIDLVRAVYEEYRTPELCKRMADLRGQLGEVMIRSDEADEAQSQYEQTEELLDRYKQQTMSAEADIARVKLYDDIAEMHAKNGDIEAAEKYYNYEEALAEKVFGSGKNAAVLVVKCRICFEMGGMLEKEKFIEEAINKYIEAYRIIGEISALSRDAQRAMLYVRHTVAEKIYETAKAHGLKEYEKQYRTEMKKTRPRSWSSLPRMDVLKELWSKDVTGQGGPFDPLTTCVETMADMISGDWDDELLGALNKLVGFSVPAVFAWCRRNVYFWRIPFYPALSMILMLVLHFTNGYTDWSRRSLCYWDCLAAQSLYQCTASLAMAIAFCVINSIGRLKRKKLALAGAAVILGAVAGWYSMQVMGRRWLTPDNMHYAFLIIPFYTAFVGRMYTKIANTFLGRIERK